MPEPERRRGRKGAQATIAATPGLRGALIADFDAHGASAVAQLREADPIAYLKLCAELLDGGAGGADDAALVARVRALLAQLGALSDADDA